VKTKKYNKTPRIRLWIAAFAAILVCFACPFISFADDEPATPVTYIYLDLSAGNITVTGTEGQPGAATYSGAVFDANGTKIPVSGTLGANEALYVYQSNGDYTVGVRNGEFIRPKYTATRVSFDENTTWGEYITDHPNGRTDGHGEGTTTTEYPNRGTRSGSDSVDTVITEWKKAVQGTGRAATNNKIKFEKNVGNVEMVLDNIWSSYQISDTAAQNRTDGSIGYHTYDTNYNNNHITLTLRGDNRVANIYYSTKATKQNDPNFYEVNNRLIFEDYGDESEATLTVANNETMDKIASQRGQWWASAIGSSDGSDACYGLIFNGGIIYAGTTARDDCTAIGGGGNGAAWIRINGGTITAVSSTSGAAIGGGIGKSAQGGSADIQINGGNVYAYNFCYGKDYNGKGSYTYILAAAIGGGSSSSASGCDKAIVEINGGYVYAQSVGGTAIGGGSSITQNGGNATVTINGGTVHAKSIGGTLYSEKAVNGSNIVTIEPGAAIGGGTGSYTSGYKGGYAKLTVEEKDPVNNPTTLVTGSIGGGSGNTIGYANVLITGGSIQGQVIMEGSGSTFDMKGGTIDNSNVTDTSEYQFIKENGGAVYMVADNGSSTIESGTIKNCSGNLGGTVYMSAGTFTMSGGDIYSNSANSGGAVYMDNGTFTMSGGKIGNESYGNNANNGAGNSGVTDNGGMNDGNSSVNNGAGNNSNNHANNGTNNGAGNIRPDDGIMDDMEDEFDDMTDNGIVDDTDGNLNNDR